MSVLWILNLNLNSIIWLLFHWLIQKKRITQENLDKIEKNADDLDSVLNLRVNSALKQEFSRICKLNQSSASSELKRYMLKIVKQGSL